MYATLPGSGSGVMLTPFSQGMPTFSLPSFLDEAAQERLDDRLVHDQHLERRAALAVERQRAQQALLDRELDVGVGQDDRGVLGVEAQDGPQAVRLGRQLLEVIGDLARADQGQHVDLARASSSGTTTEPLP